MCFVPCPSSFTRDEGAGHLHIRSHGGHRAQGIGLALVPAGGPLVYHQMVGRHANGAQKKASTKVPTRGPML